MTISTPSSAEYYLPDESIPLTAPREPRPDYKWCAGNLWASANLTNCVLSSVNIYILVSDLQNFNGPFHLHPPLYSKITLIGALTLTPISILSTLMRGGETPPRRHRKHHVIALIGEATSALFCTAVNVVSLVIRLKLKIF